MSSVPVCDESHRAWARAFDRAAETYDAVCVEWFGPIGRQLVTDVHLRPGERVLDVGCGRGAVLFPAAESVGPSGMVLGIDLAPGMVKLTKTEAQSRGLTQVDVAVMDAQAPPLAPRSFDVVVAGLVLFFLARPADALRHYARLLRPGGRLAFTSFAGDDVRWRESLRALTPYLPRGTATEPPKGMWDSTSAVEKGVTLAGFGHVTSVERPATAVLRDPEHWWKWSWSHGHRRFLELIEPHELPDARAAALVGVEALRDADGRLRITERIRYTVAELSGDLEPPTDPRLRADAELRSGAELGAGAELRAGAGARSAVTPRTDAGLP